MVILRRLQTHAQKSISSIASLRNGGIATGSDDQTIKLWNRNGNLQKTLTGHSGTVKAILELVIWLFVKWIN